MPTPKGKRWRLPSAKQARGVRPLGSSTRKAPIS